MQDTPLHLAELTTEATRALLAGPAPAIALVPVGSVEPHGPHLPLATDTLISQAAAEEAATPPAPPEPEPAAPAAPSAKPAA